MGKNRLTTEIIEHELCCGCGTCAGVCPTGAATFSDPTRSAPCIDYGLCTHCDLCYQVCPGKGYDLRAASLPVSTRRHHPVMGSYLGCYTASSLENRNLDGASSGGITTAILTHMLEHDMAGQVTLVEAFNKEGRISNPVLTGKVQDVLAHKGTKYIQSPINSLIPDILSSQGSTVIVGTPCVIAGVSMAEKIKPGLKDKICLKIGFLCGYAYSPQAMDGLLQYMQIPRDSLETIIGWRHGGLPGGFAVELKDKRVSAVPFLTEHCINVVNYALPRCEKCRDPFAVHADIVIGDRSGWDVRENFIIVRTNRAQAIIDSLLEKERISLRELPVDYAFGKEILGFMAKEKYRKTAYRNSMLEHDQRSVPHFFPSNPDIPVIEKIEARIYLLCKHILSGHKDFFLRHPRIRYGFSRWAYTLSMGFVFSAARRITSVLHPMKNRLNVVVVGCGSWGNAISARVRKNSKFRLWGFFDTNRSSIMKSCVQSFSWRSYQSFEEVLNDPRVDAVLLALPNEFHAAAVKQAVTHKKHVFVEKPVTDRAAEAEDLKQLETGSLVVMTGHAMRFEGFADKIREIVDAGTLGDIRSCVLERSVMRKYHDWRQRPESCHGGVMSQLGIHLLDLLHFWFPHQSYTHQVTHHFDKHNLEELQFNALSNGMVFASITASFLRPTTMYAKLLGSRNVLEYKDGILSLDHEPVAFDEKDSLFIELDLFADAVLEMKPFPNDLSLGCRLKIEADSIVEQCTKTR